MGSGPPRALIVGLIVGLGALLAIALLPSACSSRLRPAAPGADPSPAPPTADLSPADKEALDDFTEEVGEYVELHRRVKKALPDLPKAAPPAAVHAREVELEKLIAQARAGAGEGDIFESDVQPYFRRICREAFSGPDGRRLVVEIREEAVERASIKSRVNARYPDRIPLSAVPFQLLKVLPPLPEELEYRILGNDLILLDVYARIIVDYVRNVLPR